jgi:amino acid transporter
MHLLFEYPWLILIFLIVIAFIVTLMAIQLRQNYRIRDELPPEHPLQTVFSSLPGAINVLTITAVVLWFLCGLFAFGMATNAIALGELLGVFGIIGMIAAVALLVTSVSVWWVKKYEDPKYRFRSDHIPHL